MDNTGPKGSNHFLLLFQPNFTTTSFEGGFKGGAHSGSGGSLPWPTRLRGHCTGHCTCGLSILTPARPSCRYLQSFRFIWHQTLMDIVRFDLIEQNSVFAAGKMWTRTECIPIRGCFSAQAADLHSVWRLKRAVRCLRRLGDASLSDSGVPVWVVPAPAGQMVTVSLAQFRDNVMVACSSREHQFAMSCVTAATPVRGHACRAALLLLGSVSPLLTLTVPHWLTCIRRL